MLLNLVCNISNSSSGTFSFTLPENYSVDKVILRNVHSWIDSAGFTDNNRQPLYAQFSGISNFKGYVSCGSVELLNAVCLGVCGRDIAETHKLDYVLVDRPSEISSAITVKFYEQVDNNSTLSLLAHNTILDGNDKGLTITLEINTLSGEEGTANG